MTTENDLFFLPREEIKKATSQNYRQYFCGNLQRPQLLQFMQTERLEVGISDYQTFTADTPHYHSTTADMIYILSGEFHVLILENEKTLLLHQGDFLSIPPEMAYASKAKAGTKVLFFKYCNGNDKVSVEPSESVKKWLEKRI